MSKPRSAITAKTIVTIVQKAASEKKAEKIVAFRLDENNGIADWFVVCEGDNRTHTVAIGDAVVETLAARQQRPWHIEGRQEGSWIVIDYVTVVVHIMTPETRRYYALEQLWNEERPRKPPARA